MHIIEHLKKTHILLASMAVLQVLWLATIWLTGAAPQGWQWKMLSLIVYTIVAGVAVAFSPAVFVSRIERIKNYLVQNEKRLVLILSVAVLAIAAFYAAYQRVLTDESLLLNASRIVAKQGLGPFFANYTKIQWLGRQHPPLVPLFFGLVMSILGTKLFVLRLVSLLLTLATVLLTYFSGADLYDRETGLLAALFLLSFPYFLRMGTAVLTDIPITLFFTLGLFLTQRLLRKPTFRLAVAAGISIGAGLLTKYTMVLIYPVILGYFVIQGGLVRRAGGEGLGHPFAPSLSLDGDATTAPRLKSLSEKPTEHPEPVAGGSFEETATPLRQAQGGSSADFRIDTKPYLAVLALVSVGLLAIWLTYAYSSGILTTQSKAMALYVGVATTDRGGARWALEMLSTRLTSALGLYNVPLIFLSGLYLIKSRGKSDWLILLWIAVVFVTVTLTLPDARYFIPAFPALGIAMARAGVKRFFPAPEKVVLLALLYGGGALYLLVNWYRASYLLLPQH